MGSLKYQRVTFMSPAFYTIKTEKNYQTVEAIRSIVLGQYNGKELSHEHSAPCL